MAKMYPHFSRALVGNADLCDNKERCIFRCIGLSDAPFLMHCLEHSSAVATQDQTKKSAHNGRLFHIIFINIIAPVKTITKPKFTAENRPMYCIVTPGLCFMYSLNVIRLANEAISVPAPPMFTPSNKSW